MLYAYNKDSENETSPAVNKPELEPWLTETDATMLKVFVLSQCNFDSNIDFKEESLVYHNFTKHLSQVKNRKNFFVLNVIVRCQ